MKNIEIDLDTYKLIESQRVSFEESANQIIKRVFEKTTDISSHHKNKIRVSNSNGSLVTRIGDCLPEGLKLRRIFKGILYEAVVEKGFIQMDGEGYTSPSDAAKAVTHNNRNGWSFWDYYNEDKEIWESLQKLRSNEGVSSPAIREGALRAVERLLKEEQRAMHYQEITDKIIERGYWHTSGRTPKATVNAQLSVHIKENGDDAIFVRPRPGCYYLRELMED